MGNTCKFTQLKDLEIIYETEPKIRKEFDEKLKKESKKKSMKESEERSRKDSEEKTEKISDEKSDEKSADKFNLSKNEFPEIKEYRKKISKMNIFKRKEKAKNEYKAFMENELNLKEDNKENIKNKYIRIMHLLLIDNTNKDIVKLYLHFIKKHSEFIRENRLLSFQIEINNYKIIFTVDEMKTIEKNLKNKSQKDIFLNYIDFLSKKAEGEISSELCESIKESATKELNNLFLFNTPIEFDNEELIYYKCYYNIIYETANQNVDKMKKFLKNKKNVIEYIIKKDLYNNKEIILNEDKMNLLCIYLLKEKIYDNLNEEGTINFNRLIQKMPVRKEDYEEYKNKFIDKKVFLHKIDNEYFIEHIYNKSTKIKQAESFNNRAKKDEINMNHLKGNESIKNEVKNQPNKNKSNKIKFNEKKSKFANKREGLDKNINNAITIALENACIQNLFDSRLDSEENVVLFYNLERLLEYNELTPYITDIKSFLKNLVDKKVYKQVILKLFPEHYNCLITDSNEEIKQYIDERIKFYPYQNLGLSGLTDKLSCYSFIPSINFKLKEYEENKELKINDDTKKIYKFGFTIVNTIHEINHANQIIIFFKGNDKNLIDSPERNFEGNISSSEGGESLEYLLFGKKINRLNLFECLYILNEKNYEQDLNQFRENFIKINDIVKKTEGKTKLIKIREGIFANLYYNAIEDIHNLINDLKEEDILVPPQIYIEKSKAPIDDEIHIIREKCAVLGGRKLHN